MIGDFWDFVKSFVSLRKINERGNIGLVAAIMLPALALLTAGTIELTRLNDFKAQLQNANDAVALTLLRTATNNNQETNGRAVTLIGAELANSGINNISSVGANVTENGATVFTLTTTAQAPMVFVGVLGLKALRLKVVTTVKSGSASATANGFTAEIAFVLDQTASMLDGDRISNLKTSVDTILASINNGGLSADKAVKVAIVPFNTRVRIDPVSKFSFVNYHSGRTSMDCASTYPYGGDWYPMCAPIGNYNADAVCASFTDQTTRLDCRSRIRIFDQPQIVSGNSNTYNQIAVTYVQNGSSYKIYKHTMQFVYTWGYTITNDYYDEAGWHDRYVPGTETITIDSQEETTSSNLNDYNNVPSGWNAWPNNPFTWVRDPYMGWGPGPASSYSYFSDRYGAVASNVKRYVDRVALTDHWFEWEGCIEDREQNYDVSAEPAVATVANSLYYAGLCDRPPETILGLTTDIALARAKVQSIQPAGYTNITIGVQWGMEVLSQSEPFASKVAWKDPNNPKIMILVTDGYNNNNRFTNNIAAIDARTRLACQAAKDLGIKMYVIKLVDGDSDLLKSCASEDSYYYDLNNASQLADALSSIFSSIKTNSGGAKPLFISK